jgi:aminoglycoside phosphotransferase (APT) family kinase protein
LAAFLVSDNAQIIDELAAWAREVVGASSIDLTRLPGGGRHEAWLVAAPDGQKWFLRCDSRTDPTEHYTLRREAELYGAARQTGVPIPAVLGVHPAHEAVLLEHCEGASGFMSLDPAVQHRIIDDFAPLLARMHAVDPAQLHLPSHHPITTIAEHTERELDIWQERLTAAAPADPFLTACFLWLRTNNPQVDGLPSLVQGDTGPGNFLHDGATVTAILDFELAHIGDPMTDLAWVGTRNAQEPVPDFARFLERYAQTAKTAPDSERIRFHALFAELRIAVLSAGRSGSGPNPREDLGAQIIYSALHYRLTVEALAAAAGVSVPTMELVEPNDTAATGYFDGTLLQMREIVGPEIHDPFVDRRFKNMARTIKYLREVDRVGPTHAAMELSDLKLLLGSTPSSVSVGRGELNEIVRRGELNAVDLLPYAAGRSARQHQLAAPAMGVLATRHLPAFDYPVTGG